MSLLASYLLAAAGSQLSGWNLSNASYNGTPVNNFNISAQESYPNGIFFKPDGIKMYIVGQTGDDVNEYDLSTAWDITTASYVQNFSVATQETNPKGVFFKDDGTKMYITGGTGDDVNEYDLSTAWDVSTASYSQNFLVSAQESSPQGLFFKSDGTRMYIIGSSGDDVNQYTLSTAWDISTASYHRTSPSISTQETTPTDIFFKSDGTKMYVIGNKQDKVHEYTLSSAWDVQYITYVTSFSVKIQAPTSQGLFFKSDGTKMYVIGSGRDTIYSYDLSTAWDLSTASFSYPSTDYYKVNEVSSGTGLFFKPDGTKVYLTDNIADDVTEYNLSTAWDITTASYSQAFSVLSQETNPNDVFFKDDGTKMYIIGHSGDDVNEYNLSTAWDISTASYSQAFSVAAQQLTPTGLFFKSDGTKMYIIGSSGTDGVYEYDLSTAWDVSTASYVQVFSVATQESTPQGVSFKDDGTKMYVISNSINRNVYEYNLSTAWDVSTASYSYTFSIKQELENPTGLFFKDDGTKMYIIGTVLDAIWSYDL